MRVNGLAAATVDFNPRPPRGGRHPDMVTFTGTMGFQSTPSARRATAGVAVFRLALVAISIHALREEGDSANSWAFRNTPYFNPRPPRGGRQAVCPPGHHRGQISIHALREEGDWRPCRRTSGPLYFNPRPPRGGRRWESIQAAVDNVFQSTPSARRATRHQAAGRVPEQISIHALREEGDRKESYLMAQYLDFNPRPPRGGRPSPPASVYSPSANFNPRPPRGGRRTSRCQC